MKRYENYKSTQIPWVSQVPSHWVLIRNANILMLKHNIVGDRHTQFNLLSLTTGGIRIKNADDARGKVPTSFENYQEVLPGDMVFCLFDLDCSAVFSGKSEYHGMITSAYDVAVPNLKLVSTSYLDYWFRMVFSGRYYKSYSKSVRYTINWEIFKALKTSIPPRAEQDQIVRYLDWQVSKINRLIAAKRKQIELLHEQFSAVINSTISGYDSSVPKYDSGISLFGQIPQGWHVRPFSKIATVKSNLVDPALYKDMQQISPASIEKNTARILELCTVEQAGVSSPNHYFYKGQIIYSKIRPLLNKVIIAPFDGLCSADMYPIETVLDTEYLLFYLLSSSYLQQLSVTANRVKMPKINQEELGATLVLIPPEQEQREIVAIIKSKCSKIQLLIEKIKLQIDAASDLRTRLISDVVTGQIDVRGIEVPDYEHYDEAPENAAEESSDADYDTEE